MKPPIGAIFVHRRKTGDEAWIMDAAGQFTATEPPARRPDTKDVPAPTRKRTTKDDSRSPESEKVRRAKWMQPWKEQDGRNPKLLPEDVA